LSHEKKEEREGGRIVRDGRDKRKRKINEK
jgi:hypothetical protein